MKKILFILFLLPLILKAQTDISIQSLTEITSPDSSDVLIIENAYYTGKITFYNLFRAHDSLYVKLTGNQTIAGNKTFSNFGSFKASLSVGDPLSSDGYLKVYNSTNNYWGAIAGYNITGSNKLYQLPPNSGTLATQEWAQDSLILSHSDSLLIMHNIWTNINEFDSTVIFTDSVKFNGLWYEFPTSYLANSILWDSAGTGILKWKLLSSLLALYKLKNDTTALTGYGTRNYILTTYVPLARTISTTSPLSGGGDLSTNRTLSITQAGSGSNGYLSSTDWNTFNNKQAALTTGNLTESIAGLQFSATRQVIGGAADLSLSAGYVIPTTTEESNWNDAYSKRVDTWNYPLSISGNVVSFGYNATNLKLTSNQLNTIQDIATSSSPTFANFTLSGGSFTTSGSADLTFTIGGSDILPYTGYSYNLGSLSKKYLTLHAAELWVETLVAQNTIATIGGRVLVGETNVLVADLSSVATTINVKYNNFTNGDRVYMEADSKVEFLAIASSASGTPGNYTYTVTRNLDGSGANDWYAGDALFNTGTTGDGFIDMYSFQSMKGASQPGPTIVGNIRNSATYNDWSEGWAIGNLNGLYGYGSTIYGVGLGKYASGISNLTVDPTNGIRIRNYTTTLAQWDNSGNILIGQTGAGQSNVYITSGAIKLRNNTTDFINLDTSGNILLGQTGAGQSNIYITSGAIHLRNNITDFITLATDGTGTFAGNITSTATITGGTFQTASSGQRVIVDGTNNRINFYDASNNLSSITGYSSGFLLNGTLWIADNLMSIYSGSHAGHSTLYYGGFRHDDTITGTDYQLNMTATSLNFYKNLSLVFEVNGSGQLTKINNILATSKYVPIGDGTSFSPRLLAMSDLPALTASRVLVSDVSGYVSASSVTSTTLGYLDATSSIQTQLNGKQATITGAATSITSSNLTASKIAVSDGSGKVAVSSIASSELFTPAYGELYDNVATSTISTNGSSYVKWTGSTVGNCKGVTGSTVNDNLTIDSGQGGVYRVNYSVTFTTNAIGSYYWGINVNGALQGDSRQMINVSATSTSFTISGNFLVSLSATNTVDLGCFSTNGHTVTITYANLSINKLSN